MVLHAECVTLPSTIVRPRETVRWTKINRRERKEAGIQSREPRITMKIIIFGRESVRNTEVFLLFKQYYSPLFWTVAILSLTLRTFDQLVSVGGRIFLVILGLLNHCTGFKMRTERHWVEDIGISGTEVKDKRRCGLLPLFLFNGASVEATRGEDECRRIMHS